MTARSSARPSRWQRLRFVMTWLGIAAMLLFVWLWTDSSKVFRQMDVQLNGCHIYLLSYGGSVGFAYSNFEEIGLPAKWDFYSEEFGLSKFEFPSMVARKHAPEDMDADFENFVAYWFVGLIGILAFSATAGAVYIRNQSKGR